MATSVKDTVFQCVVEICGSGKDAYREDVALHTGLKQSVVDEHLKNMASDEQLIRVRRGVYCPAAGLEDDTPVSSTILLDGRVKIETGDQMITVSQRQMARIALLSAGYAFKLGV